MEILFGLLGSLSVLLAVLAAAVPMARALRKRAWIATRPRLIELADEQLPGAVGRMLAEVAEPLAVAGFVRAGTVHAPEFSEYADWTQMLFVNRASGERASITGHRELGNDYFDLFIATETSRECTVITAATEVGDGGAEAAGLPFDVPAVLSRHRDKVTALMRQQQVDDRPPAAPIGLLPAAGAEIAWLQERAERAARGIADSLGYRLDAGGEAYRLTWRVALHAAMLRPLGRGRTERIGFAVRLTNDRPRGDGSPAT